MGLAIKAAVYFDHLAFGSAPTPQQKLRIKAAVQLLDGNTDRQYVTRARLILKEVVPFDGTFWGMNRPFASWEILLTDRLLSSVDEELIASTILHETIHTTQLPILKSSHNGEKAAYQIQSDFLRQSGIQGDVAAIRMRYPNTNVTYLIDLADSLAQYEIDNPAITP